MLDQRKDLIFGADTSNTVGVQTMLNRTALVSLPGAYSKIDNVDSSVNSATVPNA